MSLKWWEQILLSPEQQTWRLARELDASEMQRQSDQSLTEFHQQRMGHALELAMAEVRMLRAALSSLTQLLVERGVVDEAAVKQRYDEAMAELSRPSRTPPRRDPAAGGDPYRAAPASEPHPDAVVCQGCGAAVPAARSNVTARGVLCDTCYGVAG